MEIYVQDQDQDNGSNLVNESKLDVEPVSDCRHPFRAASVWTHDDRIPAGFLVEMKPPPLDVHNVHNVHD